MTNATTTTTSSSIISSSSTTTTTPAQRRQARRLEVRYGQNKSDDNKKRYVHMLNSTLIATERAMCCVVENYQTKSGINVPPVLQEFMGGVSFIPFVAPPPKGKKGSPPPPQYVPSAAEAEGMSEAGRSDLLAYLRPHMPAINAAMNAVARDRPKDPLAALAAILGGGAPDGGAEPAAAKPKEQRGGLHKFDPDEVDVEGGKATAEDFMDAFGF